MYYVFVFVVFAASVGGWVWTGLFVRSFRKCEERAKYKVFGRFCVHCARKSLLSTNILLWWRATSCFYFLHIVCAVRCNDRLMYELDFVYFEPVVFLCKLSDRNDVLNKINNTIVLFLLQQFVRNISIVTFILIYILLFILCIV